MYSISGSTRSYLFLQPGVRLIQDARKRVVPSKDDAAGNSPRPIRGVVPLDVPITHETRAASCEPSVGTQFQTQGFQLLTYRTHLTRSSRWRARIKFPAMSPQKLTLHPRKAAFQPFGVVRFCHTTMPSCPPSCQVPLVNRSRSYTYLTNAISIGPIWPRLDSMSGQMHRSREGTLYRT